MQLNKAIHSDKSGQKDISAVVKNGLPKVSSIATGTI